MKIRRGKISETDMVIALEEQFDSDSFSEQQIKRLINVNIVFVAEIKKKIVGYVCVFYRNNSNKSRIYSIVVDKEFQGKGIGNKLLCFAERQARKDKKIAMTLEVDVDNLVAKSIYLKRGYKPIRTIKKYYENGNDALKLIKCL
jgi:[ribosomal protein S18]-alanine N-acetyltransferase